MGWGHTVGLGPRTATRSARARRAPPTTLSRPSSATCRASTHPAGTRARRSRASCASFNARISGARGRSGSRAYRARLPLGGISKGTLQSGTQRIGTVTSSPPRRGRTGDYLPPLGLSEVARLQACDLWFDHTNGYGTHGFDGSCAVQTWRGPTGGHGLRGEHVPPDGQRRNPGAVGSVGRSGAHFSGTSARKGG